MLCNVSLQNPRVLPMVFNSALISPSKNTGRVTRDHVKSSQMRNETLL